jgi:hypothetical protein
MAELIRRELFTTPGATAALTAVASFRGPASALLSRGPAQAPTPQRRSTNGPPGGARAQRQDQCLRAYPYTLLPLIDGTAAMPEPRSRRQV